MWAFGAERSLSAAVAAALLWGVSTPAQSGVVPWSEVLGAPRGAWPEPADAVVWRDDLPTALREARDSGRPLFVTLRCLPCQQCAAFDQDVLEGGEELSPLLSRFVTVRLTDAAQIDLTRLPVEGFQDLDLSWWGYFLSPRAELYGVFGGRDHVSDATRISAPALVNALRRVLDHHSDPRREGWGIDGPPVAADRAARTPLELAGYGSWRERNPQAAAQTCLHCHQVAEVLRQPALDEARFDKARAMAVWPLPENVGITLDRDDGLLVTAVAPDSAAAAAGVEVGDRLAAAGGRRLFSQTDFRGVLHRGADPAGEITLRWLRGARAMHGRLRLASGWRRTVLDWRMSISQGNVGADPGFFPLAARGEADGMAVTPFFGRDAARSAAYAAGLRPHHVVVAVDGVRDRMAGRSFLVWFRLRYDPGDAVVFTVRDGGEERDIRVVLGSR